MGRVIKDVPRSTESPDTTTRRCNGHCFLWKINLSYSESLEKLPDWVSECDGMGECVI